MAELKSKRRINVLLLVEVEVRDGLFLVNDSVEGPLIIGNGAPTHWSPDAIAEQLEGHLKREFTDDLWCGWGWRVNSAKQAVAP